MSNREHMDAVVAALAALEERRKFHQFHDVDKTDPGRSFEMGLTFGCVRWHLTHIYGLLREPEPPALDPEAAERVRKLKEKRDALADRLYHEVMGPSAAEREARASVRLDGKTPS